MKLLFVCSRNRLRSPTAEALFAGYAGVETASAGTSPDAECPLSADLIDWADVIFAMENVHKRKISQLFSSASKDKKIVVLRIPDQYKYMDDALVTILQAKVTPYLG